LNIYQ